MVAQHALAFKVLTEVPQEPGGDFGKRWVFSNHGAGSRNWLSPTDSAKSELGSLSGQPVTS